MLWVGVQLAMARLVVTLSVVLLTVRARRITSFSVPRWVNVGEERREV